MPVSTSANTSYPSQEQLHLLFDSTLDVICSVDTEGKFQYVSKASYEVWGYTPEELIGRKCVDFVVEEDIEKTNQVSDRIIGGFETANFNNRYYHKDGRIVPIVWSARWNHSEQTMFCIARNASERQAEEELKAQFDQEIKRQHREMEAMMERITDGFVALDTSFTITYFNVQAERILGKSRDEVIGRSLKASFPGYEESPFYTYYSRAFEEQVMVQERAFFEPMNKWFEVSVHPSEAGLSVFFRDITTSINHEKEIEATNKRLTDVLENTTNGFIALNRQWEVTYWNRQAEVILKKSRQQTKGKVLWEVFSEAGEEEFHRYCHQCMESRITIQFESYSEYFGIWFDNIIIPTDEGVAVFFQDITIKKKSELEKEAYEQSLQNQNTLLDTVLEHANEGFMSINTQGDITYWNKQAERLTGYPRQAILGKNIWSLYPGLKETLFYDIYRQLQETGLPITKEILSPFSNRWVEVKAYTTSVGISIFFSDITERKEQTEELRRLSLLAEQTVNAVVISDADRRVIWVNRACCQLSGYSFEEVAGKHITTIFDGPFTDPEVIRYSEKCVEQRKEFSIEALNYRKNGETYWAHISCQPLYSDQDQFQGFFSIATDITEQKRLEEERKAQQKKINAAAIKAQENERAVVGQELHDNVNQVLTSVKLYQELCLSGIGNQKELLQKSAELLQLSINEIRSLSKRLSAPLLGNIKLTDTVRELVDTVAATNRFKVELNFDVVSELEVTEDLHLTIYRILQEHLTNILKYAEASKVEIVFDILDNHLVLKVRDDGKGFDTKQKSNGIGITNMRSRTESMNGTITINSAPGLGCVLIAGFPLEL